MNDISKPSGPGNDAILRALANPTNSPSAAAPTAASPPATRKRIPLSIPRRKLEVDPIPGYVLYWFLESNVNAALDAGYEFVGRDEVRLNQQNPANSADDSGNTDLGSQVSVLGNKTNEYGKPERLKLMKIREEFWREDRKLLDDRNASVIEAIFGPGHFVAGQDNMDAHEQGVTYVKTAQMQG